MKKRFAVILFTISLSVQAQNNTNINGIWQDSCGASFKNGTAIFAVRNDSVFFTHYLEYNKMPFVEYGKGTIKNNILTYEVWVSLPIPGWSTGGRHELKLSADGLFLRGSFHDNLGFTGPLVFKKTLPKNNKK